MSVPAVAVLGDGSSHGGTLITTNQDNTVKLKGLNICANGCLHSCPIPGHGTTPVTAIATITKVQSKLIITYGATAGCGAVIEPPDRTVYAN